MNRRLWYSWIWLLIGSLLFSCVPALSSPEETESTLEPVHTITQRYATQTPDSTPTVHIPAVTLRPPATITASPAAQNEQENDIMPICSPLAGHPLELLPDIISDPYAPPPNGREGRHMGVDFSYYQWQDRNTIAGVEVQSIFPGKVAGVLTENNIPYGYAVFIESDIHLLPEPALDTLPANEGDNLYVLYAHLQTAPMVALGDKVTCGQTLGLVGQTGGVDTPYAIPHLHVEMRLGPDGWHTTEMGFYDTRISETARETYLLWRTSGEFRHFDPMLVLGETVTQP